MQPPCRPAESMALGQTRKGGPAAVMEAAAAVNERLGKVGSPENKASPSPKKIVEGTRVITEAVGGQVVGTPGGVLVREAITIGEALEATALSVPDKPVDQLGDAAAIQAAEVRATGINQTLPGSVGATAQSAATFNAQLIADEYKTTISDIIGDATQKLPADKAVTREDAKGVIGAEVRNKPDMSTTPGGVAASMAAAAWLNENK